MIPKTFIPERKRIAKVKRDLLEVQTQKIVSNETLDEILKDYKMFLFGTDNPDIVVLDNFLLDYSFAKSIFKGTEGSINELQPFCDKLIEYEKVLNFHCTGTYLSLLVNQIIWEAKKIKLKLPATLSLLDYVGSHLCEGVLIIKGHLGDYTGKDMSGGRLIVEGSIGHNTGFGMTGGELYAEGIGSVSPFFQGGRIYDHGKKIRG